VGHPSNGGVPFVEIRGAERDLEEALKSPIAKGIAKFVEPNARVYMIPEIAAQESAASGLWGLNRIGVDSMETKGAGVHVYVLDTGMRSSHQDFGGRAVPTLNMITFDPTECEEGDHACTTDDQGHGTHCAGVATSATYGVASEAIVHAVKVLDGAGGGQLAWTYGAIDWLIINSLKPTVASMSLGLSSVMAAYEESVNAAVTSGIVVVVAAGNSNADACNFSPAFVSAGITVGSTDSADARSSFSNFGRCVDIYAPGTDIRPTYIGDVGASEVISGTSMSCPAVSGGAAVLLGVSPELTPPEVAQRLLDTAENGAISGLKSYHVNKLLWVGNGPAPVPAPTEAPDDGMCLWYCDATACSMNECSGCAEFC